MRQVSKVFILAVVAGLLCIALSPRSAVAQVPPHMPGTICFTPNFWCWAQFPGPPGTYCECWYGGYWYPGTLG